MAQAGRPSGTIRKWWWAVVVASSVAAPAHAAACAAEGPVCHIERIRKALAGTGITIERLIERGGRRETRRDEAQGGPFIPARPPAHVAPDFRRWQQLRRALHVLPLGRPLDGEAPVTSEFGQRRDPINHRAAVHEGIDLKAPLRTPVHATGAGRVVFAGRRSGYGKTVEIDHGLGVVTRYAHLGAIHVAVGQRVGEGRRIGLLGRTGRTTGPHLHYEVIIDGRPNNPARFMRAGNRLKELLRS